MTVDYDNGRSIGILQFCERIQGIQKKHALCCEHGDRMWHIKIYLGAWVIRYKKKQRVCHVRKEIQTMQYQKQWENGNGMGDLRLLARVAGAVQSWLRLIRMCKEITGV